jgi:dihydrofolate reductase
MRKIVSYLFISLDGVTQAPNEWQFDHFDEDMGAIMGPSLENVDTILLGRTTYQEWEPYWSTSDDQFFAPFINNTPKIVVSQSLKEVQWTNFNNATLLEDDFVKAIQALKQQEGQKINVAGSPGLVLSLLEHDLLDELHLMIHPVVVGSGKRLFKEGTGLKRLKLSRSQITRTGVSILTFEPREA